MTTAAQKECCEALSADWSFNVVGWSLVGHERNLTPHHKTSFLKWLLSISVFLRRSDTPKDFTIGILTSCRLWLSPKHYLTLCCTCLAGLSIFNCACIMFPSLAAGFVLPAALGQLCVLLLLQGCKQLASHLSLMNFCVENCITIISSHPLLCVCLLPGK